jgi:prepilin-type N-terminal cleavage/methylation domain-containing protein
MCVDADLRGDKMSPTVCFASERPWLRFLFRCTAAFFWKPSLAHLNMLAPFPLPVKLQIELMRGLHQRQIHSPKSTSGFTFIELLVVVSVIGLIVSVAIPTLLRARNRSEAGAVVGELTGLAKECAMANASKLQEVVSVNGVSVTCNGYAVTITGRPFLVPADGVVCLGVSAGSNVTGVQIAVSSNGSMSCSFT